MALLLSVTPWSFVHALGSKALQVMSVSPIPCRASRFRDFGDTRCFSENLKRCIV